jgi:hypothetical protein
LTGRFSASYSVRCAKSSAVPVVAVPRGVMTLVVLPTWSYSNWVLRTVVAEYGARISFCLPRLS